MLVLARSLGEKLFITTPTGDVIEICLVRLERHRARLGITAPNNYTVIREELADDWDGLSSPTKRKELPGQTSFLDEGV